MKIGADKKYQSELMKDIERCKKKVDTWPEWERNSMRLGEYHSNAAEVYIGDF